MTTRIPRACLIAILACLTLVYHSPAPAQQPEPSLPGSVFDEPAIDQPPPILSGADSFDSGAALSQDGPRLGIGDVGPGSSFSGDLRTRSRLTGDWAGLRSGFIENGLKLDVFSTQFYQGVASGGDDNRFRYGGKVDYLIDLDGGKLNLRDGLYVKMHAETRYGQSTNETGGLLVPSILPLSWPAPGESVTALTGVKIIQQTSDNFAFYLGKFNNLDDTLLQYYDGVQTNKPGLQGFMYASLATNPIVGLTIQYSTAATGFAILREDQPVFTFTIFDPELRATTGVEGLYSTGVVLVPDLLIRGNLFGRPGIMELGGSWSSAEYTSLSPNSYLNPAIPELAASYANQFGQLPVKTGSWCMWSNFYQALWVDRVDENVNWGVFGEFGISDGNPNPVQFVANGGITGQSMIPGRKLDAFGIGYFYLGLSDSFKSLASPISPQVDERGVELFYNYAIKPSMRLTFDLQLVRPSTSALETAIIPGIRFQTIF